MIFTKPFENYKHKLRACLTGCFAGTLTCYVILLTGRLSDRVLFSLVSPLTFVFVPREGLAFYWPIGSLPIKDAPQNEKWPLIHCADMFLLVVKGECNFVKKNCQPCRHAAFKSWEFFKLHHNKMTFLSYGGFQTKLLLLVYWTRRSFVPFYLILRNCEQSLSTYIRDIFDIAASTRRHSSI